MKTKKIIGVTNTKRLQYKYTGDDPGGPQYIAVKLHEWAVKNLKIFHHQQILLDIPTIRYFRVSLKSSTIMVHKLLGNENSKDAKYIVFLCYSFNTKNG